MPVMRFSALIFLLAMLAPAATSERSVQKSVNRWMKSLSLRDKAAQLVMIPFSGHSISTSTREYRKFVHLIRDVRVGGLILVNVAQGRMVQRAEPHELASFINRMQRMSRLPLLVSGDFERGASMRVNDTTVFPHAMAFAAAGDPAFTRYEGEVTARESRARLFRAFVVVGDNDEIDVKAEQRAAPRGELPVEPDVDRTGEVRFAERLAVADIEYDRAAFDRERNILRRESPERREAGERGRTAPVDLDVAQEIFRFVRQLGGQHLDEGLARRCAQRVVRGTFAPNRRTAVFTEIFPAE